MLIIGKDEELICEDVKTRDDILETPITEMPKIDRFCYLTIKDVYGGAILKKRDLKRLMKWCQTQLDNWDEN